MSRTPSANGWLTTSTANAQAGNRHGAAIHGGDGLGRRDEPFLTPEVSAASGAKSTRGTCMQRDGLIKKGLIWSPRIKPVAFTVPRICRVHPRGLSARRAGLGGDIRFSRLCSYMASHLADGVLRRRSLMYRAMMYRYMRAADDLTGRARSGYAQPFMSNSPCERVRRPWPLVAGRGTVAGSSGTPHGPRSAGDRQRQRGGRRSLAPSAWSGLPIAGVAGSGAVRGP